MTRVLLRRPQIRWNTGLRVLGWAVAAFVAVVGTISGVGGLGMIVFLFVLLHGIEVLFPRHDQPLRRPGLSVDLLWAVVGIWVRIALTGLVLLIVASILGLDRDADAVADWQGVFASQLAELPPLVHALLGGILIDLLLYWGHRLFHTVPVLWRFHAIHHSIRVMDWAVGSRNHPVQEVAFSLVPGLIVIGLGFDPLAVAGLALVFVVVVPFIHTNARVAVAAVGGHRHHPGVPSLAPRRRSGGVGQELLGPPAALGSPVHAHRGRGDRFLRAVASGGISDDRSAGAS